MVTRIKPYLHWLILFPALLIGFILYTGLAPVGLGVSTDGVNYLFTASNLTDGRGYISYDNTPLTWWPPLYPTLLAGLHRLTGADLLSIAFCFNVATFIALAVATLQLAWQLFPERPLLVLWATILAAGGPVLVAA
ncbi:MAG: hypothetical protein PHQ40_19565, partial [Anaerolineaceae bacterium]|nr:hypothetical protein [Anaerolineaceae bacterium]